MPGKLVICPTPIGNLGDITLRTVEALRAADVVCAEDTRVTGKLLAALDIRGKRVERLDENLMGAKAEGVVARVQAGETVAYCTDAGMPGVSDPGLRLVRAARDAGVAVEVLPGASAATTAYVASGCANDAYYFGGFFPRKDSARRLLLDSLKNLDAALVFYESPKRLVSALECIADMFPRRQLSVCRELTKLHEEVVADAPAEVLDSFTRRESVKGEIVIVIEGPTENEQATDREAAAERAAQLIAQGERAKSIAKLLSQEFGLSRNEAYELALASQSSGR